MAMTVAAHRRALIVWDVPSAVECGRSFRIRVGVKCAEGCPPEGWLVEVSGDERRPLAAAAVGEAPWPGTDALHVAELALTAPADTGLHAFEAVARAAADEVNAHAEATARFNVRAVPPADCRLRVEAIDRETRSPVEGARVVLHPYRAVTDARGVAELLVPRGRYRLFVSGRDFFPFRSDGELTGHATIRAELDVDRAPSDAELWP